MQLRPELPVLVTGGGGFIGGHVISELRRRGFDRIRVADIKPVEDWYQLDPGAENLSLDLRLPDACAQAVAGTAFQAAEI